MLNAITTRYGRRVGAAVLLTLAATLGFVALFAGHVATVGTPAAATAALTAVGVVVTLNLGLLGIVLVGNVAVELRRLTETAEAVGRGEFDASATSDRRDEIGRLFDAFDETRRSLRDAVAESERAQSEAETAREEAEALSDTLLDRAEETGVASCGETRQEALEMLDEAVSLHTGASGEPVTDKDLEALGLDPDSVSDEAGVPDAPWFGDADETA